MASMIKSGKILRHLTGLARNLVFNSHRITDRDLFRFTRVSCTTFSYSRGFASAIQRSAQNVDESIKKLDDEVRRVGRISRHDVQVVFDEIRRNKTATSSQSLLLIRCCGNSVPEELPEVRTALVQDIWKTLNNFGVAMDVSHYNALLRVYLDNEHPFSPTEFLADLESKGIVPNRITYQRLISRYCHEGDMEGATKILEFMREKKVPLNENVFNSLIIGHSEAGDIEAAVGILPVMQQAGLEPTSDTYTNLMCSYAKHGKTDEILSTLDKCESSESFLTDKQLFEVIYSLATNGHADFIDNILPRVQKSAGYNQISANLILRLVNKNQDETAFKILKTMPRGTKQSGEFFDIGSFFIKQLVKSGRPAEKIIPFCVEMQRTGLHNNAMILTADFVARTGNIDDAVSLFRELKQSELPLRQHYFQPLISAAGKVSQEAMLDVVRKMLSEFDMIPNGETVRGFVLPYLQEKNYEKIILTLRTAGITSATAISSSVHLAITNNHLNAAANIMSTYGIYYQPGLLRRPLVEALKKTDDLQNYQRIVRSVYENLPRLQKVQKADANDPELGYDNQLQSEVIGDFVMDAVVHFGQKRTSAVEKVLAALVEQGLSMSKLQSERIQQRLGSSLTPEISTLLEKLTAGDLEPVAYEMRSPAYRFDFSSMPTKSLEKMIQQKEAQGENTNGLQRALLQAYYKAGDLEKYEELLEKLSKSGFVISSGLNSQLIDLHCCNNGLDKALALHAEIKAKEPDFVLSEFYTIKLVKELVANDRIDEAIEFLRSSKRAEKSLHEHDNQYHHLCWSTLNQLAEKGSDADVTKLFDALDETNFIQVSNSLLGPLVRVHLVNNDITGAMQAFETIATKYKCTPLKSELSCKLIALEDATKLQMVTDIATSVHGEVNCLYDLVLSFVECGRIRQARKILDTPGLPSRPQRITDACKRFRREGKAAVLESLVQVTKDLNNIDHHEIFYNLLLCYCTEESPEKALDLWTNIQEMENVYPSDQFMTTLANYLKEKGVTVPFVVPTSQTLEETSNRNTNKKAKAVSSETKSQKAGNVNKAIKTERTLDPAKQIVLDGTKAIEKMVQQNQLDDATQRFTQMIEANSFPLKKTIKFYVNKIAQAGRVDTLEKLSPLLTPEIKKQVSFHNRLGNAYIAAGKSELFLDQVIKDFNDGTTEEELKELENTFPKGAICGILKEQPELLSKFETFAHTAAERGYLAPINVLWMNHIENGKFEQADHILKSHLREESQIMFKNTLRTARGRKDETIVLHLLKSLADSKISEAALAVLHSCLIDIYCLQQKYDKALIAVNNSVKDVCLDNIHRETLFKVKNGLEAAGKTFPHQIPNKKKAKAVDSSSSSDDESTVKN